MNILFVTPIFIPLMGGASLHFNTLLKYIVKRKDVSKVVILTRFLPHVPVFQRVNKTLILRLLPYFPSIRFINLSLSLIFTPIITFVLVIKCVKSYSIDIIHFHAEGRQVTGALLAARFLKVPCVADVRDLPSARNKSLKYSDIIIYSAKNVFKKLCENGDLNDKKLIYIPSPIETPKYGEKQIREFRQKYNIPEEAKIICFIGDITFNKGIFELIDAFNIFKSRKPEFKLVIIGRNLVGERFIRTIMESKDVLYLGPLPHYEAMALLQSAEILVLPSRLDALPRVCLEAISLGVKVILPAVVDEFREYCPDNVLYSTAPPYIAEKMEEILAVKSSLRYPIGMHNAENTAKKLYEVYRALAFKSKKWDAFKHQI